ncbi:N-acetylmuramic acid 6-phosphate etherase [Kosakonia sp. H02]|nr:N-acetylmuramic acid 6-phosphate etherase [Kosakonia sp. H02]
MSSKPNGSMTERRNSRTHDIDRLTTLDMLTLIHQEEKYVKQAIADCLPAIARLVDNASATLHHDGRVVLVGAGASGQAALQTARDFAPDTHHRVIGLMAGGAQAQMAEQARAAADYARGMADLQAIEFSPRDMLVAVSVSGKTPWTNGALRHAWSVGARVALLTRSRESEAAQIADIVLVADTGAEVVSGFSEPKARQAQVQILNMLATGLAIRTGRVYSNLRVDLQPASVHWVERQIAVVMAATDCSREQAKSALAQGNHHCRTAILMLLTGLDAAHAQALLAENNGHLRVALNDAQAQFAGL